MSVNGFEWVGDLPEFDEGFIKNYNEKSKEEYFLEVDVPYTEKLHELHNDLPFLPERMKIEKEEYFLEVDVLYTERLHELHNDLPFLPERMKIEKVQNLLLVYMIKMNMLFA